MVGLVTVRLALTLTSPVALVAEDMVPDWPALLPLHAGIKDQVAVLTLEALGMKVLIHCSDPGCFGLAFFWYNRLCANTTESCELACVTLGAVDPILIICRKCLPDHALVASLTVKTIWMEDRPCNPNDFSFNFFVTLSTLVHMRHVVLLAEHLVIELIVGSLNNFFANSAHLLGLLKILLTDWFILKEKVCISKRLLAYMALHTARVIVGVVVDNAVPNDLLLADAALLLARLVTFSTVGIVVLREELPIQLLLAAVTSEAVLVEDLTKSGTAVIREVSLAVVTTPCGLVHRFYCPISDSCQHVRVAQILTGGPITWQGFCGCSRGPEALIWRQPSV